jgi:PKD repeat protein
MKDGVIVSISCGGPPAVTETTYDADFKANIHMNWNTGDNDAGCPHTASWSTTGGYDYYTNAGFATSLDILPGVTHDRTGAFGGIMEEQIIEHVAASTATDPAANTAPTASFTSSISGVSLTVDGSASTDADGSIVSCQWDFGDGTTAVGAKPAVKQYANAGTYTVKLSVTDDKGLTGTTSRQVTTKPAILSYTITPGTTTAKLQYKATSDVTKVNFRVSATPFGTQTGFYIYENPATGDGMLTNTGLTGKKLYYYVIELNDVRATTGSVNSGTFTTL